ncbi:M48 family metalloprotease [Actinoplanes sp. RD1]|uniref:M48 family metalloprotease n=1 Tax=Actinoplanes sp. RD1 TaxID=3064538 RepID=UPI0027412332|nr:M48 family metalloprotease [Actinoplanes sp. RD1]
MLLFWRVTFMPAQTPTPALSGWLPGSVGSVALNLALIQTVARFFARRPRLHVREATDHVDAVRRWSARFRIPPPRLLVSRSRFMSPVGLRGWRGDAVVVITTKTLVRWNKSDDTRTVHLAHELAHAWARDQVLYYWTRSLSVVAMLFLLLIAYLFAWNGDEAGDVGTFLLRVAVLATLTFVAGRAYLRYREHVADVTAMMVTDDVVKVRAELVDARDQTLLGRVVGTHPGREARLAVLFNPMLLLKSERWTFLLLGLSTGFFTSATAYFLTPLFRGADLAPRGAGWAAAVISAVLLAAALPVTITEQFAFHSRSISTTLLRGMLLLIGTSVGYLVLSPMQLIPGAVLRPAGWLVILGVVILAAVVVTAGCLIVVLTANEGKPRWYGWLTFRAFMLMAVLGTLWLTNETFAP